MRKFFLFLLVVFTGFIICISSSAWATSYFGYDDWGGTYYDANKTWNDDGQLCWAAATSNTLAYTGWGFPTVESFNNEQDIFTNFVNHWPNYSGYVDDGLSWWFSSENSNWPHPDVAGGGNYYPQENLNDLYHEAGGGSLVMSTMDDWLRQGDGISLTMRTNAQSWNQHSISIYGVEYDDNGDYLGFYFTDNIDGGYTGYDRYLRYQPIVLETAWDGSLQWIFNGGGHYSAGSAFIREIQGLGRMPVGNPVPEPATMLLFGLGLLGLAGVSRKKQ